MSDEEVEVEDYTFSGVDPDMVFEEEEVPQSSSEEDLEGYLDEEEDEEGESEEGDEYDEYGDEDPYNFSDNIDEDEIVDDDEPISDVPSEVVKPTVSPKKTVPPPIVRPAVRPVMRPTVGTAVVRPAVSTTRPAAAVVTRPAPAAPRQPTVVQPAPAARLIPVAPSNLRTAPAPLKATIEGTIVSYPGQTTVQDELLETVASVVEREYATYEYPGSLIRSSVNYRIKGSSYYKDLNHKIEDINSRV